MNRGPLLFARFAFPPNRLGYCGPSDHQGLFEMATAAAPAAELAAMARAFEGAYPYLQLIAAANGIADPLDARVVEAYWVGSPRLEQVDMTAMGAALDERFRPRVASRTWNLLAEAVPAGAVPHHSFHVFGVYPWLGLIREGQVDQPLRVLDQCRIRWGVVRRVEGDQAVVQSRPLVWDGRALGYGPPREETVVWGRDGVGLAEPLQPGDTVAMHWEWVCDRLSERRLARLRRWTQRHLDIANGTPHPAPAAVLA
ncbi:MAG: DUF6390 family protein [Actinomycetota bacterium]